MIPIPNRFSAFFHGYASARIAFALATAVQTVDQMAGIAGNSNSSTRNRVLAGSAATLHAYNNYGDIKDGATALLDGNLSDAGGVSISLGTSQSSSRSDSEQDTARGSSIAAGGNVTLNAKEGDIFVRVSTIDAGQDLSLIAKEDIILQAAENRFSQSSSHESSSASIGLSISSGSGISVNLSASGADGRGVGEGLNHSDTIVSAGGTVTMQSGGDTTLQGPQVIGEQVKADVGGDLRITSLQDHNTYDEESQSWGVGISIPIGVGAPMVNVSRGETDINSEYHSVVTQSGIRAGDGGFQVNVAGSTSLEGGVISSTQTAVDSGANSFHSEGGLTLSGIDNWAEYDAEGYQVGFGTQNPSDNSGSYVAPNGAGYASDSGSAYSTSQSGISGIAGNTETRTGKVETGLKPIFDQDKVRQDIQDGVLVTAAFGSEASQAAGTYADQMA